MMAAAALGQIREERVVTALLQALQDRNHFVRERAAAVLERGA